MTSQIKFPIRAKLIALMAGFVVTATVIYLLLAIQLFKEDKTQLIYELNASNVKTLAAEIEASLLKVVDKIKLLTQGHRDSNWVQSVFESDPDLVSYTLFVQSGDSWTVAKSIRNADYLKTYHLETSFIDQIRKKQPIPFGEALKKGNWVSNSTFPGGAPILTMALNIELVDQKKGINQTIAVIDIRMDKILKLLTQRKLSTIYLVDREGGLLAHPDAELLMKRPNFGEIPIVSQAIESLISLKLSQFEWKGKKWLGAFASVQFGGLSVVSQIEESEAFFATRQLVIKSVLFALLVVTISLLASNNLARSFTEPLHKLLAATERLANWDFKQLVHVKTRDEIAALARAFNKMAGVLENQKKQIQAHQSDLERKVLERTQALEQEKRKLAEAQETLIRTTRLASLGELAGAAAHEVLNPINNMNIRVERMTRKMTASQKEDVTLFHTIITSWMENFKNGGWEALQKEFKKPTEDGSKTLGEEDLENLNNIATEFQAEIQERNENLEFLSHEMIRITRIVNNMRSLSRVGGERRPLDIHLPLEETAVTLGDLLQKKNVSLVKDFSAESRDRFSVIGDKDELVQVFVNLIRNSVYAVSESHRRVPTIRISTQRNADRIEIRIADNGTGIKKENQGKIFETSFTTKSFSEGTGLGLSISRRLVRAFGGDLVLEKTIEGEGTVFLIWFPAAS